MGEAKKKVEDESDTNPTFVPDVKGLKLQTDERAAPNNIDNVSPAVEPNPFNVAALRLPPSFEQTAGVKKMITTVPVRKPHNQEWIRVHPGVDYRGDFATIRLKEEGEHYLLVPSMIQSLLNEITLVTIYTVINKAGVVSLWPVPRPSSEGRGGGDTWHRSAHEAAAAAMKRLTRVTSNRALGAYEIGYTDNPIPDNDPVWPDLSFEELLRIGFEKIGRYVKDYEHPVIKMLRGL
jgi:hypothetical protein